VGGERAGDRVRTGDIQLGRLTLYQLSYSRIETKVVFLYKLYMQNKFEIKIEPPVLKLKINDK
jgi:hypothetical protein